MVRERGEKSCWSAVWALTVTEALTCDELCAACWCQKFQLLVYVVPTGFLATQDSGVLDSHWNQVLNNHEQGYA